MKRSWLARHPVGFMALYSIFYLSVFHYLESNVPLRSILVHCRLDDLIPFCKYAVIPYFAWFVWIPFTLFYLLWKAPREDFWRLCLPLFGGMTLALACSKYSAMKAMGWRENQLRFIEKASFLRLGKLLAIRNYTPGV